MVAPVTQPHLQPAEQSSTLKSWQAFKEYSPFMLALTAAVLVWEISVWAFDVKTYLLPAPTRIVSRLISTWPVIARHSFVTLQEVVIGFFLGATVGIALAIGMAYSRFLERILYPFIVISQTFPKEALAPLLLVWLGFGIMPKIAVAALISFFPVAVNTAKGLTSIDPLAIDLMRCLSASQRQVFFKLRLPSCLPDLFAALKMAITLSVIGAIVGEFVGASAGLGYLMQVANTQLATDLTFAALVVLGFMAMILFLIMDALEKLFLRRHEKAVYTNIR